MAYPKDLLGKVATRPNLHEAWKDISRSARPFSYGYSNQTIQDFHDNLQSNLEYIRNELKANKYRFGFGRAATIGKRNENRRPIVIADIRDRVVQRALARVLFRCLGKKFDLYNKASHGYLKGKGVQTAIKQMLDYHISGSRVIFEADIEDFFGSVDLNKLLGQMIFPNLPDETINGLISKALKIEIGNRDQLTEAQWELFPERFSSLPQGGYLSPLCSNIYLSQFDKTMLDNGFRLIRYADDFIVMCDSLSEAEDAYAACINILEKEFGLKLHPRNDSDNNSRTRVVAVSQKPIEFLGIRFNGSRIWPSSNSRKKLSEKINKLKGSNTVKDLLYSMNNLVEGWAAAYSFTDITDHYSHAIDNEVNKNLWHALYRLSWGLDPKYLNSIQKQNSGVNSVISHRDKIRLYMKHKDIFSQYWTIR